MCGRYPSVPAVPFEVHVILTDMAAMPLVEQHRIVSCFVAACHGRRLVCGLRRLVRLPRP